MNDKSDILEEEDESFYGSESQVNTFVEGSTSNNNMLLHNYNIIHNFDTHIDRRETARKKHKRRCARELKKEFPCLYNCGKEYATDAARNMHMREKHDEVTKTERDRKSRDIIRTCGLKNNSEIINKLSQLTKQQQNQLESELILQTCKGEIANKENDKKANNCQK